MKISVVVGGSKGNGLAISKMFVERGDKTYNISRFDDNSHGFHVPADLVNVDDISRAFDEIFQKSSVIDYLVFSQRNRTKTEDYDYEFKLTLNSVNEIIEITKNYLSKNASIVVLGSPASQFIVDETLHYHTSKAALESLVKYYAVKLGPSSIRVNCILPGTVIKKENKEFYENNHELTLLFKHIIPLSRQGTDDDIAKLVSFLCSDDSSFITGQNIFVDGGLSLVGQESLARKLKDLSHSK